MTKLTPLRITLSSGQELPFFDSLSLTFSSPIKEITDSEELFWVYFDADSLPISLTNFSLDDTRTKLTFDTVLEHGKSYRLVIPDSSFFDFFNQTNSDTLNLRFRTNSPDTYTRLDVTILNKPEGSCILQVLNERMELIEQIIMESDSVSFTTLKPGKYRLRLIVDQNLNGRWDAGNLRERRLPEPVFILPKVLTLEAGWEYEEEWEL